MIDLFGTKEKAVGDNAGQIKEWMRQAFDLGEDVIVMVSELRCLEEGCPPLETVIAIMREDGKQEMHKLYKAVHKVIERDVFKLANGTHKLY